MIYMVGAILTGAKIAGSLLGNLLNKKAQQQPAQPIAPQTFSAPVQAENITLDPSAVRQAPSKNNFMGLLSNGLSMLSPVMGAAGAPAIQGLGGLAKNILSTLNDDEWFEHYDGNGATFNDMLTAYVASFPSVYGSADDAWDLRPFGAIAALSVTIRQNKAFYDSFMPQVLAYVREKSNNILQDDTTKYTLAVVCLTKLYEVYYTLLKYYKFVLNTPANAPTLPSVPVLFRPENLNATKGIIDSLESYLKSTAKLPYAYTSYIRWRFGTMFLSSNTKRAGFITYDYDTARPTGIDTTSAIQYVQVQYDFAGCGVGSAATPAQLSVSIENIKSTLVTCGRAASDMAVAYKNHVVKYDVEDRHFDEKEFCLRQNLMTINPNFYRSGMVTSPSAISWAGSALDRKIELLLDSRLDMNAAIQAVTISTDNERDNGNGLSESAPFPISGAWLLLLNAVYIKEKWPKLINYLTTAGGWTAVAGTDYISSTTFNSRMGIKINALNNAWSAADYASKVGAALTIAVASSLELHQMSAAQLYIEGKANDPLSDYAGVAIRVGSLSYDRATISNDALKGIQRNAILNLMRGDYANKRQLDVKEEATEVVEDLTNDSVKIADSPIPMPSK